MGKKYGNDEINEEEFSREEDEIIRNIREKTENIDIPESLSPENMMKRINESKEYKAKGSKKLPIYRIASIAACATVVVAVGMAALFRDSLFKNQEFIKVNSNYEYNSHESELVILDEPEIGEVQNTISNIGTREDIIKKLKKQNSANKGGQVWLGSSKNEMLEGVEETTDAATGIPENSNDLSGGASQENDDYYKNNDQVEGVVEGDMVINDGKYIYSIKDEYTVVITETDNGQMKKSAEISVSEINNYDEYEVYIQKLFVNKNKLVIIASQYYYRSCYNYYWTDDEVDEDDECEEYDENDKNKVIVFEFDITDRTNPSYINSVEIEGTLNTSRMVGDYVYVVSDKNCYEYCGMKGNFEGDNILPKVAGCEINPCHIYGMKDGEDNNNFMIVAAMDIENGLEITDSRSVLMSSGEVYVSNENIYVVQESYCEEKGENDNEIIYSGNSIICKFAYKDGAITPVASAKVKGSVLNQFSMDEYKGNFRVFTTVEKNVFDGEMYTDIIRNQTLCVLDDGLNTIGSLEGIAEDEIIKSARFMGDRAYLVTFLTTDPLFVVDLSEPTNPKILNELKVPGFSEYLHKWDDGLLLGIGKEADEETGGLTGELKLSMFSIENDELSEIAREKISDAYNDFSYDYKKILVDSKKNLIGFDVSAYGDVLDDVWVDGYASEIYENECGNIFVLYKYEDGEFKQILNYRSDKCWKDNRGLYIGDYLYIVVDGEGIKSFNLNDITDSQYLSY